MAYDDLWKWAERNHGLLRAESLTWDERRRLPARHQVERLSPRVYRRVGAPRTPQQRCLAAVLDAGQGAVVAGQSAAWLWRLPGFRLGERVELTRQRGVAFVHRPTLGVVRERRLLAPHHTTEVAGIPVLTLPVLLYQLAGCVHAKRLERVASSVIGKSPAVLRALHALLPELAERGRNGITTMRAFLGANPIGNRMPTGLERRFEEVVSGAGEKPLVRQVDVGGHEWLGRVDYLDPALGLVVEIQSRTYHSSALDRTADEHRIEQLCRAGFAEVLLVDEELLWHQPSEVGAAVRDARRRLTRARAQEAQEGAA